MNIFDVPLYISEQNRELYGIVYDSLPDSFYDEFGKLLIVPHRTKIEVTDTIFRRLALKINEFINDKLRDGAAKL